MNSFVARATNTRLQYKNTKPKSKTILILCMYVVAAGLNYIKWL